MRQIMVSSLLLLGLIFGTIVAIGATTPDTASAFFDLAEDQYSKFLPATEGKTAVEKANNLVERASGLIRLLIGSVASLMAITGAIQMVISQGEDERYEKGKSTLIYGIGGLAIIALSQDVAQVLSPEGGGFLGNDRVVRDRTLLFDNQIRIIITFVKYIVGSIAVAMLIRSGFRMVTLGQSEDEIANDKKNIGLIAFGLIMMIVSDTLIRRIFYKIDSPLEAGPQIDLPQAIGQFVSFTNLMVTLTAPIGVLTLVAGGLMYALSGANEELAERGKKMITVSMIGIILIYSAFGIVNTFILGRF